MPLQVAEVLRTYIRAPLLPVSVIDPERVREGPNEVTEGWKTAGSEMNKIQRKLGPTGGGIAR